MLCTLFIRWYSLAVLLSTVVLVTGKILRKGWLDTFNKCSLDSCSSTLRSFRRREVVTPFTITTELPTTSEITSTSTTETITFIPLTEEPEETSIEDKLSPKDQYDHIRFCNDDLKNVYCQNGGTCYSHNYNLEGEILHCECHGNFYGEYCQYKALEGRYGGGLALSKKRSIRRSNDTELHAVSRMFKKFCDVLSLFEVILMFCKFFSLCVLSESESKPRKNRRRGRQAVNKKDRRPRTTDEA